MCPVMPCPQIQIHEQHASNGNKTKVGQDEVGLTTGKMRRRSILAAVTSHLAIEVEL
jgi:adenylosuccinate synthase